MRTPSLQRNACYTGPSAPASGRGRRLERTCHVSPAQASMTPSRGYSRTPSRGFSRTPPKPLRAFSVPQSSAYRAPEPISLDATLSPKRSFSALPPLGRGNAIKTQASSTQGLTEHATVTSPQAGTVPTSEPATSAAHTAAQDQIRMPAQSPRLNAISMFTAARPQRRQTSSNESKSGYKGPDDLAAVGVFIIVAGWMFLDKIRQVTDVLAVTQQKAALVDVPVPTPVDVETVTAPTPMAAKAVAAQTPVAGKAVAAPTSMAVKTNTAPTPVAVKAVATPPPVAVKAVAAPTPVAVKAVAAPTPVAVKAVTAPTPAAVKTDTAPSPVDVKSATPPTPVAVKAVTPSNAVDVKAVTPPTPVAVKAVTVSTPVDGEASSSNVPTAPSTPTLLAEQAASPQSSPFSSVNGSDDGKPAQLLPKAMVRSALTPRSIRASVTTLPAQQPATTRSVAPPANSTAVAPVNTATPEASAPPPACYYPKTWNKVYGSKDLSTPRVPNSSSSVWQDTQLSNSRTLSGAAIRTRRDSRSLKATSLRATSQDTSSILTAVNSSYPSAFSPMELAPSNAYSQPLYPQSMPSGQRSAPTSPDQSPVRHQPAIRRSSMRRRPANDAYSQNPPTSLPAVQTGAGVSHGRASMLNAGAYPSTSNGQASAVEQTTQASYLVEPDVLAKCLRALQDSPEVTVRRQVPRAPAASIAPPVTSTFTEQNLARQKSRLLVRRRSGRTRAVADTDKAKQSCSSFFSCMSARARRSVSMPRVSLSSLSSVPTEATAPAPKQPFTGPQTATAQPVSHARTLKSLWGRKQAL